ncbi:TnsA endonuclease N-terminal domain-containing protein [Aquipseudomonas alcaligenes]|uniref:TnsA endonuclease N-terminal domain-containing protein n=1 Tax=Aquipseudomonas alcaligenes TaxID=43263 RepID=UPI00364E171F
MAQLKPKQKPKGVWSKPIRHFYSVKNLARFWCESLLERDALLALEFDEAVESYKAQPVSFAYTAINGKPARYTPDQLVKFKDDRGYQFREIKMAKRIDDALQEKMAWIRRHINDACGAGLEIVTDEDIRLGDSIFNMNMLYPYKRVFINRPEVAKIKKGMPQDICFSELKEYLRRLGFPDTTPFALLANGEFRFDFSIRLTEQTALIKV